MDVRTPAGLLLVTITAAAAVHFTVGWDDVVAGVTASKPPAVTRTTAPGSTTVTVLASTPRPRDATDMNALLAYVLRGRWPDDPLDATVRLDDRRMGITPLFDRSVEPGARQLGLSRIGYLPETITFQATADTAHTVTRTLFRIGEHEARSRYMREASFYERFRYLYLVATLVVSSFHAWSLLMGLGRRFFLRMGIAAVHVLLVGIVLIPMVRFLIASGLDTWLSAGTAGLLLVMAPFGLYPRARRMAPG